MTPVEKDLLLKKISRLGALPHFTDMHRSQLLRQNSQRLGPMPNMEQYSNREAVGGHFSQTKKVNKLSQYYMDLYVKQKANQYKQQLSQHSEYAGNRQERELLNQKYAKMANLAKMVQRQQQQSLDSKRRSTDSSRIPGDGAERANTDGGDRGESPGPGSYIDIYKNSSFQQKTAEDKL